MHGSGLGSDTFVYTNRIRQDADFLWANSTAPWPLSPALIHVRPICLRLAYKYRGAI